VKIKDADIESGKTVFYHHKRLNYNIKPDEDIELSVILEPTELITLQGTVLYDNGLPAVNADIVLFIGNADPNTWLDTLHPPMPSGSIRPIYDRDIFHIKTDEKGFWKIITTRETQEGVKLAYWSDKKANTFSIGVEAPKKQSTLIQDIVFDPNETQKEINIQLEDPNAPPKKAALPHSQF
jgi:hypothetical protein